MSRSKEGDHIITTRTEVREDHGAVSALGGKTTAGTVVALVPRVVPAWLRSIVTATGVDRVGVASEWVRQ
jgi:hypothetical protein